MPKAALANPDGPLAVVGHVDLAWTYGFVDPARPTQSRAARIFGAVQAMARGSRAGVALDALMRSYREVNDELLAGYQAEEDARVHGRPIPADPGHRAGAFMLRNDLRGYVLLGDPAARLPLRGSEAIEQPAATPRGPAPTPEMARAPAPGRDPAEMEEAVLALLRGDEPAKAIAARHAVTRAELDQWVETYRAAGRAALGKLARKAAALP
jgi:helix-turn-helix protein